MKKKTEAKVELMATLPLTEILAATGIQLIIWSELIDKTDPNDSYEPFTEMKADMLTHSQMLAEVAEQFPTLCRKIMVKMPDYIGVVRIKNPLRDRDSEEGLPFDKPSRPDVLGGPPF